MNPETVIFLLKLACFFICVELLTRRGLPTKFVYKLRFDKPLKFGNYFIFHLAKKQMDQYTWYINFF